MASAGDESHNDLGSEAEEDGGQEAQVLTSKPEVFNNKCGMKTISFTIPVYVL